MRYETVYRTNRRRRVFKRGDIIKSSFGFGSTDWYVVDDDYNREYAQGPCFFSYTPGRVGKVFGLTSGCIRVPPSKVPQYALVALAKFRLTQ